MIYGSVCSGIEAATVAWHPLGWKPVYYSEIDSFPSAVLSHYYPTVPNRGDMTLFKDWPNDSIELLVGGTPCQSFSVAGKRAGLDDPRGNLALVFLAIAKRLRPRWILWENVPGVLSANDGRDFGAFLWLLAQCGYGWAYRILNAEYFGVPQRRRRVFVVGYLGDWRRAAAVLFERQSLSGNTPKSKKTGQGVAAGLTRGTDSSGKGGYAGRRREDDVNIVCSLLDGNGGGPDDNMAQAGHLVADIPKVAWALQERDDKGPDSDTKEGHLIPMSIMHGMAVRRLTVTECERLMGFATSIERVILRVCIDHQKQNAHVEIKSLRSQSSAYPVGEGASSERVSSADVCFWNDRESVGALAAVHVRTSYEPKVARILSRGKCLWSVSGVERPRWFPPFTERGDFARALAAAVHGLAKATQAGKVESPANTLSFILPRNGSLLAEIYGHENVATANGAVSTPGEGMRFITSALGHDINCSDWTAATWCYCALVAIDSFIPVKTYTENFFSIVIDIEHDYTQVPYNGKPASDGPRYRALGNSMAVPVMHWLGKRIEMADKI